MNPQELCRRLEHVIAPLDKALSLAHWAAETTGRPEDFEAVEQGQRALNRRLSDRNDYKLADQWRADATLDASTRRQLERWRQRMARQQVDEKTIDRLAHDEAAIIAQFNAFRAEIDGKRVGDNDIDRILAESHQSAEVETAWRASKRIADYRAEPNGPSIVERLRDLVRLRNDAARQIGYPNGYVAALELSDLDSSWLFETLDALDRHTRPLFERWKNDLDQKLAERFGTSISELRPWHYGDRFFQTPPQAGEEMDLDPFFADKNISSITIHTFDAMGFDIRPIVAKSDLFPQDPATSRKCQHAFCTTIEAPHDVRVLCNIVPNKRWMSTNLHEFGHAVYGASLGQELPYPVRDDAHLLANESIAMLMERHMNDAQWLETMAGASASEARDIADKAKRALAVKHLVFTRWVLVMCHFERALYENPDREDLGRLWWDLVERFQLMRRPSREHADHDWASKIHFIGYPAYYQNYLLGEVFGAQLEDAVKRACGGLFLEPTAGKFLVERMFKRGATLHWNDLLKEITGSHLKLDSFLARLEAM